LAFILRILNPKKIPSEIFTIPSAVKKKLGVLDKINPVKIPQKPPMKKNIVMIPSLRMEGLLNINFDFVALLNIE
jgi:hypothetical protein